MQVRRNAALGLAVSALGITACGGSSKPSTGAAVSSSAATQPGVDPGYQPQHAGGTLHLLLTAAPGSIDPVVFTQIPVVQLDATVYDSLMAFAKAPGALGETVVPDLAQAMPVISNGGKTYTFTLRRGIRFSNGQPVTVQDVAASMRRIFTVPSGVAQTLYSTIRGATQCLNTPATCTLNSGVSTNAGASTVTISLTQPDPLLLRKLALPIASIVPANAPRENAGERPLPGTGPYMYQAYNPTKEITLVRNPYFRQWSAAAQPQGYPSKIVVTFGIPAESEVTEVEQGQADGILAGQPLAVPTDRLTQIGTSYPSLVHVTPTLDINYFTLNTRVPPFSNLAARQAVNWAVDRNAVVRLAGGTHVANPLCTFLPPGVPGFEPECQYTTGSPTSYAGPDLARARQLMRQSGRIGASVSVFTPNDPLSESLGEYMVSVLDQLGFKAQLKALVNTVVFPYASNSKNKAQVYLSAWLPDYAAAADYLLNNLSCASFYPASDANYNQAELCDPGIDSQMYRALRTQDTNPSEANALWAKVDQSVMQIAPVVPLYVNKQVDLIAARVGHYQYNYLFYMLLDQLWTH